MSFQVKLPSAPPRKRREESGEGVNFFLPPAPSGAARPLAAPGGRGAPAAPSRAARPGGSRRLPAPRGFSRTEPAAAAVPGSRSRRRKGRRAGGGGGGVSPRALPQAERLSRPWRRRRNTPPLPSPPRSDRPARPPGGLRGAERPWTGLREEAALPPPPPGLRLPSPRPRHCQAGGAGPRCPAACPCVPGYGQGAGASPPHSRAALEQTRPDSAH